MKEKYIADNDLIRQVECKATGANIHQIKGLTCLYGGAIYIYNNNKIKDKEEYYKKEIEYFEIVLRKFLITNKLPRR